MFRLATAYRVVVLGAALWLVGAPDVALAQESRYAYGVVAQRVTTDALKHRVLDLGVGWIKLDFAWNEMEANCDDRATRAQCRADNWGEWREWVEWAAANNVRIVADLGGTPGWANGYAGRNTPPTDLQDWYDFVFAVVSEFRGGVAHWTPWNEPNLGVFLNVGAQWPTVYRTLVLTARDAIKAADPNGLVLGPELSYHALKGTSPTGFARVMSDYGWAFDIVTVHHYGDDGIGFGQRMDEGVEPLVSGRTVWVTETSDPRLGNGLSEQTQERWYNDTLNAFEDRRGYLSNIFFFQLYSEPRFALVDGDVWTLDRETPAYATYRSWLDFGPAACTSAVSEASAEVDASGGVSHVAVTVAPGCTWGATSNASWLTITSALDGAGDGNVSYTVAPNGSISARRALLVVAGHTIPVTQAPADLLLADDFSDAVLRTQWTVGLVSSGSTSSVAVAPRNGRLEIGPLRQGAGGSNYNGVISGGTLDLTGATASVRLAQRPNAATGAQAMLTLVIDGSNHYRIYLMQSTLYFEKKVNGAKTIIASLSYWTLFHQHWAITHDAQQDTIQFLTSSTGSQWTTRATLARELPLGRARYELKAGTSAVEAQAPGIVAFDDVAVSRIAAPPPPPPPTSDPTQLNDTFSGSSLGPDWTVAVYTGNQDVSIPVVQANGRVEIGPLREQTTGNHYNGIATATYDLTGVRSSVQLVGPPSPAGHGVALFAAVVDGANHYRIYLDGDTLWFEKKLANVKTLLGSVSYQPLQHAYWAIVHDQTLDTVSFETAPAGGAWTTQVRVARQLPLSAARVELKAGTYLSEVAPGTVTFDNVVVSAASTPVLTEQVLMSDDFAGTVLDAGRWSVAIVTGSQDASIPVASTGGQLSIGPLAAGVAGSHYNGILSNGTFDVTNGYARARLVTAPAAASTAYVFLAVVDGANYYRFVLSAGQLSVEKRLNGTKTALAGAPFNAATQAVWAIVHDGATNRVVFLTAPSAAGPWAEVGSAPREFALTAARIELKAGTSVAETIAPGTAAFDEVKVGHYR